MANKMLIDAAHPEETRVVVMHGNRVEEFDFESASRKQLRGNIYLAKVTRVEPSLQAAFVDYGGNRHGFLAFSEIHPDYYQIPIADRQALIEEESRAHRDEDDEDEPRGRRQRHRSRAAGRHREEIRSEAPADGGDIGAGEAGPAGDHAFEAPYPESDAPYPQGEEFPAADHAQAEAPSHHEDRSPPAEDAHHAGGDVPADQPLAEDTLHATGEFEHAAAGGEAPLAPPEGAADDRQADERNGEDNGDEHVEEDIVESIGGDDSMEEPQERVRRPRRRQYKIQEVIKRRQVMLVQVVKEERGSKGAALTTYLSLAGRYSVLMPNTARGGGISRKITNAEDRARLKEIAGELEVPEGMGVILRTAGASRTKTEIVRDFEYLLRLWETVRDFTLKATAPTLVYEEGSLIKRSIRDLYHKDIDEIVVEGEHAYREARDFMGMLMPSHVRNVKLYRDQQPIFTRYGIESQLDAMFSPTVQLKSGGYIVINQAEALVAIDVNSGRATREHNIEDTALKTNTEAAAEIARQLRLRDLAGLIVIDFIDMDENRNNRAVERKLKESLKSDRARIQVGRISHFGLLEMSRQRIRSSVLESSTEICPHCGGTGHVRSVSSVALQLLRSLEDLLVKGATHNLIVRTRSDVALYVLNHKRAHLRALEERFRILIAINADATMTGQPPFTIDRGEQVMSIEQARALMQSSPPPAREEEEQELAAAVEQIDYEEDEAGEEGAEAEADASEDQSQEEREGRRRRRGRRGRGGRGRRGEERGEGRPAREEASAAYQAHDETDEGPEGDFGQAAPEGGEEQHFGAPREGESNGERRRRRRGRRGGRRNRRHREPNGEFGHEASGTEPQSAEPAEEREPQHFAVDMPREEPLPPREEPHAAADPGESEKPRRRSTIREAAPLYSQPEEPSAPPEPPAEPPLTAPETDGAAAEQPAENQPRRIGWWSRRR
ncbi:MAG TPA: Rne/Rng family ribonuclease [Pseudorhodoplanes sp.]|nr:Rne/Rng family ribonuclease [Pseudorhodoplanes sp.]